MRKKPGPRRPYKADPEAILRAALADTHPEEIAERQGLSPRTVRNYMRKLGVARKRGLRRDFDPENWRAVWRLRHEEKLPIKEVARRVGYSVSNTEYILRKMRERGGEP